MTIYSQQTYKQLFRDYYNPLCNYAFKFVADEQIAQDAVQDVFVKFWNKREELDADMNVKAYLFTSVRNKALEHLRREKMKANHAPDLLVREQMLHEQNTEEEAEKYVRIEKIYKAVKTLPTKCQEVFTLSKINGLSYQEIADFLGISRKTVESQIVRGLKLLREKLNK